MMRSNNRRGEALIVSILLATAVAASASGCRKKTPAEKFGDKIENAGDKLEDQADKAD